ncbi:MAG: hypothetical protein JXA10_12835, partial [Anaerolineae bacterium]|nr:hypothetical protein [Anaerolineae bacterium]
PAIRLASATTRNWSIFIHLINEDGIIEAQRDLYPGGGLLATAETDPGESWSNPIAVKLPQGLYTPQMLSVYLGFYDHPTNERMLPVGETADLDHDRVLIGQIRFDTPAGDIPNPVDVNFDDTMTLRGYTITDRSLAPGDSTAITLYWSAQHESLDNYVISLQIIDAATLIKAAQDDNTPTPSTGTWTPGATVTDTRTLTIAPDAAPGRYRLLVRVYPYTDGVAGSPLRIRSSAGGQSEDFVWLSWMQVESAAE